jgi:Protein of unknown function (DUF3455)
MKRSSRIHHLFVAAVAVASLAATQAALAGPAEPSVPDTIRVEAGNKLFLFADAVGVQIHRCDAIASGYRWSFVAPRADLFDESGRLVATHFGGPTWQAKDGSFVKAVLDARVTVDPTAIDWFLLRATDKAAGADGNRFADTTFIQRLETTGGLAPALETCNAGTVGDVVEVAYTAVYAFWKASGH